ncbi:phage holin family protein [Limnovirga soli]|uniref:Phage holin family protein n=1 Tax=Limnovirga soli TaxID=2656915 RepID=A0A8J8JSL2_9BACT|nr:phage holin family protein [Limnovirga soli]NNV57107.1 hypothetical protein [Limnovirga soli]
MSTEEKYFDATRKALEEYVQDRLLLLKMQSAEKTAKIVSLLCTGMLATFLGFFVCLFISIMAGFYFAALTNSTFAGFAIVAGFYLLLLIVLMVFGRKPLKRVISNLVVKIFFDKNDEADDTGK